MKTVAQELEALRQANAALRSERPIMQEPMRFDMGDNTITEDEEADYGSDLLRVVEKKAKAAMQPIIDAQARELAELKARLSGVNQYVEQNTKQSLYAALDREVADWQTINQDEGFLTWLDEFDPYAGVQRGTLLRQAFLAFDAPRVIQFFKGYKAENAAVAQTAQTPQSARQPRVSLETLAAPGRAKAGGGQVPPNDKPVWTRAAIAEFYRDVQKGAFRGREDERNRLERDLYQAQREGRIAT
jgi:hypothetical protein